jgi:chitinase
MTNCHITQFQEAMKSKGPAMKKLFLLLFILIPLRANAQQWSMGYYASFDSPVADIEWSGLTHLIHEAAGAMEDGTVDISTMQLSSSAASVISAAHAHNVKVLLDLTQFEWLGHNNGLSQAVSNNLTPFVANVMNVVNTYGYDGVDVDWEPLDKTNMTRLASALKAQLGGKLLTAAAIITDYSYWGSNHSNFNRVNMMTYDMAGLGDPYSWFNSALLGEGNPIKVWSVNLAVQRYTNAGVPAAKLGIGIPFYGWQWTGGGISAPHQTWTSSPSLSQVNYTSIAPQIGTKGTYHWDSEGQVPYLSNNSGTPSFLSYENAQSIAAKVNYAKTNNLGGWIIWQISADYLPSGNPKHPLMIAIRDAMGGTSTTVAPPQNLHVQ